MADLQQLSDRRTLEQQVWIDQMHTLERDYQQSQQISSWQEAKINTDVNINFQLNRQNDLTKHLNQRQCLNRANQILAYLFHIVQFTGILFNFLSTSLSMPGLLYLGISLNLSASGISAMQQVNNKISTRLLKDLQDIQKNRYIDEGVLVEAEQAIRPNQDNKDSEKPNFRATLSLQKKHDNRTGPERTVCGDSYTEDNRKLEFNDKYMSAIPSIAPNSPKHIDSARSTQQNKHLFNEFTASNFMVSSINKLIKQKQNTLESTDAVDLDDKKQITNKLDTITNKLDTILDVSQDNQPDAINQFNNNKQRQLQSPALSPIALQTPIVSHKQVAPKIIEDEEAINIKDISIHE